MSHGCTACFKHLMRNCKCDSPKKMRFGYTTRVPQSGNLNDWKQFMQEYIFPGNRYSPEEFLEKFEGMFKGTKLETTFYKIHKEKQLKYVIDPSWRITSKERAVKKILSK